MKLKMFIRGVGFGIVLCAIVLFAAYAGSNSNKLSDDEIIKKAEALGMVTTEADDLSSALEENSENAESTDKTTEDITNQTTTQTTEATTEEVTETTTTESTTEEVTEATTEEKTEATTEATTETVKKGTKVSIVIQSGMTSTAVAKILENQGVIDDYAKFDTYLNDKGYATRILVGTVVVTVGDDYKTISQALCR